MILMEDIEASDKEYVILVRHVLDDILKSVTMAQLDAFLKLSADAYQAHDYLDKHMRKSLHIGNINSTGKSNAYKVYMCPCGAFNCIDNMTDRLVPVWGLAEHDPSTKEICDLIRHTGNPKLAVLWLRYVYCINHQKGDMNSYMFKYIRNND